jgi:small-conductance mechanosensitive channel
MVGCAHMSISIDAGQYQLCRFVDEEDLMRFMQAEETIRALALFDGAMESGKITKQALKNWVVAVYRERRALALSLSDMDTAVKKLHRTLDVVLALTVLIVWLLILGISPMHLLVFVFSQMLLIAFLFGNVCKTLVEAIIFMFIMHPFDVGDRCVIDGVQVNNPCKL